eukprot:767838-Hanusia_phi.AAC.7
MLETLTGSRVLLMVVKPTMSEKKIVTMSRRSGSTLRPSRRAFAMWRLRGKQGVRGRRMTAGGRDRWRKKKEGRRERARARGKGSEREGRRGGKRRGR